MMPRILLLYPPLQYPKGSVPKPDGSLGLVYLAGALRAAGHEVTVLDAAVGHEAACDAAVGHGRAEGPDEDPFQRRTPLPSGLFRVGMTDEEILGIAEDFDIIGVGSTFTPQHRMAEHVVRILRRAHPEKLILVGGTSARNFVKEFLAAGADAIALSEAERTLVAVVGRVAMGVRDLRGIPGLATPQGTTPAGAPVRDLDELPVPAWDLQPLQRYWTIGRPHGGAFGAPVNYAAMMTSRGCPYACAFCHISTEGPGTPMGPIDGFRVKSLGRVITELRILKDLGVTDVYIEDDSLLAKKQRMMSIFSSVVGLGLRLADVNGVNIAHLFRRGHGGTLEPDVELLDRMADAGFRGQELSLPFESGSQRILDAYATAKWSLRDHDTLALVRAVKAAGLRGSGNYMIGFPDETEAEIQSTLNMARQHRAAGLDEANVFLVTPFPGSKMFNEAKAQGRLPADWNPDDLWWFKPTMIGTTTPPERLLEIRSTAWRELNSEAFVRPREEARVP